MNRPLRNQQAAYCPKCETHTEQSRGTKRGERLCHCCGEPFTLTESRKAERSAGHDVNCICVYCEASVHNEEK